MYPTLVEKTEDQCDVAKNSLMINVELAVAVAWAQRFGKFKDNDTVAFIRKNWS